MKDCIFCSIAKKSAPAKIVFEDDLIMGFESIAPYAPIHYLFIPKEHFDDFHELSDDMVTRIKGVISDKIGELELADQGYRIVVNGGIAKTVQHVHFHLLGKVSSDKDL